MCVCERCEHKEPYLNKTSGPNYSYIMQHCLFTQRSEGVCVSKILCADCLKLRFEVLCNNPDYDIDSIFVLPLNLFSLALQSDTF